MRKYFLLLILLSFIGNAQIGNIGANGDFRDVGDNLMINNNGKNISLSQVVGSPYLDEDFTKGVIVDDKNETNNAAYLRYNSYNDIFEIKLNLNSDAVKSLQRTSNYKYILNGETYILINSPKVINKFHYRNGNGYVVELKATDNLSLYKRYAKQYKKGREAKSNYDAVKPARLDTKITYIFKFQGEKYVTVEPHKKKVLDAFDEHKKEIKNFIKENKIKFRGGNEEEERDLIKVLDYYNSL
jgi:hypothetical protein